MSLDFGLREFCPSGIRDAVTSEFHGAGTTESERLSIYRSFVYGKGELLGNQTETKESFVIGAIDKFKYKSRYLTDSGIVGTKEFVSVNYQKFKDLFFQNMKNVQRKSRG